MWTNRVQEKYQPYVNCLINSCDWSWTQTAKDSARRRLTQAYIADYQMFILCKVITDDLQVDAETGRLKMSPTAGIDEVWHQHLLRPRIYFDMCYKLHQVKQQLDLSAEEVKEISTEEHVGKGVSAVSPAAFVIEHTPESDADSEAIKYARFKVFKSHVIQICPGYILTHPPQEPPAENEESDNDLGASLFESDDEQEMQQTEDMEQEDVEIDVELIEGEEEENEEIEENEGDPFPVTIRTLYGTRYEIENLYSNTTVLTLMRKVQESQGIPPDQQRLVFRGRILDENERLRDHNVVRGSVIDIVLKLRGC